MIEPTDEMITAAAEAIEDEAVRRIGRDLGTIHRDDIVRAGLVAALVIVERDQVPTQEAYDAACRALEKHRERADRAEAELAAARWACIRCGYHNRGPVCTHCGEPLVVTAPSLSFQEKLDRDHVALGGHGE